MIDLNVIMSGQPLLLRNGTIAHVLVDLRDNPLGTPDCEYPLIGVGHTGTSDCGKQHIDSMSWDEKGKNKHAFYDIIGLAFLSELAGWDIIDTRWQYFAVDGDGRGFVFEEAPTRDDVSMFWAQVPNTEAREVTDVLEFSFYTWEKSLIARPKSEEK